MERVLKCDHVVKSQKDISWRVLRLSHGEGIGYGQHQECLAWSWNK